MPAPATCPDFLDVVRRSQLVEAGRLNTFLAARPADESPASLARALTAAGLLTGFQAEQLLKGRHRGFVIGKYKLLDRIGVGGMGQVYLAEHTGMGRRAAVKVLPPDLAESSFARERFFREARAVGRLDHPNLVRAFDVDAEGDVVFLVMEYVEGANLHELVVRNGPLSPAQVGNYLWQAANGLAFVHAAGLIHRDIKPANLMLDTSGTVKITDLGLVRSEADTNELTRGQGVKFLGTADFLAPEQAVNCSTVDGRADIYGLGATGYFLLTGRMPYDGETIAQKLIAHQTKPVPRAAAVRPGVPAELSDALAKMMAKKPDDRPQTPAEVMALLAPWADSATPLPTPGVSAPTPLATHLRPGPGSLRPRPSPSGSLRPVSPPAAVAVARPTPPAAVAERPPVLPAARTHILTADPMATPRPAVVNPFHPAVKPAPSAAVPAGRRRLVVAVALGFTLAVGAWDVVLLAGPKAAPAAKTPPSAKAPG
jgi:serine/threonine protein kinase